MSQFLQGGTFGQEVNLSVGSRCAGLCVCFEMLMCVCVLYVCVFIYELRGLVELSPLLSACVAPLT